MAEDAVKSLRKAVGLLRSLFVASQPLSTTELSLEHALNLRTTTRLLSTLEQEGFVTKVAAGRHQISRNLVMLASRQNHLLPNAALTQAVLTRLRDLTGETAFLVVRAGYMRTVVHSVQAQAVLRSMISSGDSLPLLTGSTGYALLVDLRDREILSIRQQVIDRFVLAEGALPPLDEECLILRDLRGQGYVTRSPTNDERSLAMPLRGSGGSVVGAVGISGPAGRWTVEKVLHTLNEIKAQAAILGAAVS